MESINVKYLEEVCGGSKEIIIEMIDIFREQVPEFYSEMINLLESEKYHDLGLLAHKAKSSVAIVGLENLAKRLKQLEMKAKASKDTGNYEEYIQEFKIVTNNAVEQLDSYIKSL